MLCSLQYSPSLNTSSEHFSICFPLETLWHYVLVRQAHYIHVVPPYDLIGLLSGSGPIGVIGKTCWGFAVCLRLRPLCVGGLHSSLCLPWRVGPPVLSRPNTPAHASKRLFLYWNNMESDHLHYFSRSPLGLLILVSVVRQRERQLLFYLASFCLAEQNGKALGHFMMWLNFSSHSENQRNCTLCKKRKEKKPSLWS